MDLVDATGRLITVTADEYSDLFFALRGAGANNYGIVTSFTFQIYPIPPKVTSILLRYDINKIQTFFDAINKLGPTLPDDVSITIIIGIFGIELQCLYLGSQANAMQVMKQFISLSQPTSNQFTEETFFDSVVRWGYRQLNGTINPVHIPNNFKVKSFYVKSPGLSAKGVKSLVSFMKGLPITCKALVALDLYAGSAATRVAANATAFVHRDVFYLIELVIYFLGDNTTNTQCFNQVNRF
ncbi:7151_t:CDS:1, partial [Racocetra fulgida]